MPIHGQVTSNSRRSTLQIHFRHRTLLIHCQIATLPRPAPFTPLSTHVFTHQSRPMRTVFCHQSLTQGQRTAFCLLGGLLQTRLPLPNRIHLKVASGTSVRALLYSNLIYCKTVSRPLISVGQLKAMLDVRFIWSDSSPLLVACSGGLKYILVESAVIHHLPVISSHEMTVILEALHDFTSTGTLLECCHLVSTSWPQTCIVPLVCSYSTFAI